MGANISLFTVFEYPNIFGGALLFSPAFSVTPNLFEAAEKFKTENMPKFYFYAGAKESTTMVSDMDKMAGILQLKNRVQIRKTVNPLGQHNESSWRAEFPDAYRWIMKDF